MPLTLHLCDPRFNIYLGLIWVLKSMKIITISKMVATPITFPPPFLPSFIGYKYIAEKKIYSAPTPIIIKNNKKNKTAERINNENRLLSVLVFMVKSKKLLLLTTKIEINY
jgi:hypothetical protein